MEWAELADREVVLRRIRKAGRLALGGFIILAVAFFLVAGIVWLLCWHKSNPASTTVATQSQTPTTPAVAKSPAPSQPTTTSTPTYSGPSAELLRLATIRKGKGVEHALIRQLMVDPSIDTERPFEGDVADKVALKKWAGREAHLIACKAGLADCMVGGWVGVKVADQVAYVLQKDGTGHLTVVSYLAPQPNDFGKAPSPDTVRQLASNISQAQFLGWPDQLRAHPLPAYEYLPPEFRVT